MVAGGAAAHSDHGRSVAEVFMSAARKETDDYKIKDGPQAAVHAPHLGVATTVEVDGEEKDRDIDEIALEVAEKALNEWGKAEGELLYLKRAPAPLYEKWKKPACCRATSTVRSSRSCTAPTWAWTRTTKTWIKQGTRASLADGWGGSMLATDLQDVLFGTPIRFRPKPTWAS
jgi:carbon-monoxide dehydrogenase catalytic subunit